jgi:Uma2 family endonuclease
MVVTNEAKFTRGDYMALPEGFPAELLDGTLVKEPAPAAWYPILVMRLAVELYGLAGRSRVVASPVDVFADDYNVLQPDVLVLAKEDAVRRGEREVAIPILVVEVLSKSTADRDRETKTGIYLHAGVREVWLVDPDAETVEIHTRAGVESFGGGDAPWSRVVPGFAPDLAALFSD